MGGVVGDASRLASPTSAISAHGALRARADVAFTIAEPVRLYAGVGAGVSVIRPRFVATSDRGGEVNLRAGGLHWLTFGAGLEVHLAEETQDR